MRKRRVFWLNLSQGSFEQEISYRNYPQDPLEMLLFIRCPRDPHGGILAFLSRRELVTVRGTYALA